MPLALDLIRFALNLMRLVPKLMRNVPDLMPLATGLTRLAPKLIRFTTKLHWDPRVLCRDRPSTFPAHLYRTSSNNELPLDPSPLVQRHTSCRRMRPSGSTSGVERHTPVISSPRSFTWW